MNLGQWFGISFNALTCVRYIRDHSQHFHAIVELFAHPDYLVVRARVHHDTVQ